MAYVTVMHNLMSIWIVQVGGGAPSWPSALLGAAGRVHVLTLNSARLNPPIFFFLSVLSRVSCDEDDDPVFEASCGSGILGCLIAEYQSHRLSLQSHHPLVASDGQHGCFHIIWSAGNRGRGLRPSLPRNALAVTGEGETMSIKEANEKG